jgi:hypothetical protein
MDTYFSLVAKAARWAAQRGPANAITGVTLADPTSPTDSDIPPGFPEEYVQVIKSSGAKLAYHTYRVALSEPADQNLTLQWQIREPGFKTVLSRPLPAPVPKGAQAADIRVFAGPGTHYVDVWLVDKKTVLDWYTEPITLDGWPTMSEVRYSKSVLLANDSLDISATIKPTFNQPRPCTFYARAKDNLGRLVAEKYQSVSQDGGMALIRLEFVDLIAANVTVEVFAVDSTQIPTAEFMLMRAAHDGRTLPVRTLYPRDTFSFVAQVSGAVEYNERGYNTLLAELGVDTAYTPGSRPAGLHLTESRLRPVPLSGKRVDEKWEAPAVTLETRKAETQRLQTAAKELWGAGSPLYVLGNWSALRPTVDDLTRSPDLQQAFGAWLQKEYGDLQRLNAAWGSAFTSWDAVTPMPVPEGAKPDHFAPWVDPRRYLDSLAVAIAEEGRNAIRAVDGDAIAGVTVSRDADWGRLASQLDLLCAPAGEVGVEKLRSYRPRGGFTGEGFNGALGTEAAGAGPWAAWHAALHGLSSVWYANAVGTQDSPELRGAVDPFGRPTDTLRAMGAAVETIKSGVGAVLLRATRMNSGIVIFDSPASAYLNQIEKTFDCDTPRAESAFVDALRDLGYSFDFMASAALTRGDLKNYKTLILPMARALSAEESGAIQRFAAEGGHVIADLAPGRYDAHGAPYPQYPLADLFGITARTLGEAGAGATAAVTAGAGDGEAKATLASVIADASLAAADASAGGSAGDVPVWLTHASGKGSALLLNHALVQSSSAAVQDPALRALLGAALASFGATRDTEWSAPKRSAFPGELFQFRYGETRLAAVLRNPEGDGGAETVRLTMDGKGSVYNMLGGARPTRAKSIPVKLKRGDVALYAKLPYEVTGIILLAPETVTAGRRVTVRMKVRTQGALAGEHVVRIEFVPRNGAPLKHYSRDVVCPNGEGETYIPLERNETLGYYQVTARDVLTGVTASTTVEVGPAVR